MSDSVWSQAIKSAADPHRARHFIDQFMHSASKPEFERASPEQGRILAALFSGSPALSNGLLARPDWLGFLTPEALRYSRRKQGLEQEIARILHALPESIQSDAMLDMVREFKRREMLRIAARDLARLGEVEEIIREISDVADVSLEWVWKICRGRLASRYGEPYHQDAAGRWHSTAGCVIGLGKLGGQELNYSSDVDVIFVYAEEGSVFRSPPAKPRRPPATLSNHQFFNRLGEAFVAEVSRPTAEGSLYRIDLRLRPEGAAGPLSRSLESYETYYAQWGQTWERMMLIKGRGVAGDRPLQAEFLDMIQPFRYPRSVNQGVLREIAAVKDRIENEVVRAGELERNVKLGRGGIREIEFIVQSQQLLRAGSQPFLQEARTLPALARLADYDCLPPPRARSLDQAYRFLRKVEHLVQMEDNLQTHTVPASASAQLRLARLMGFASAGSFRTAWQAHAGNVRQIFDELLKPARSAKRLDPLPSQFQGMETPWRRLLAEHSFVDPDRALRLLREFVEGPGYFHVSPRTRDLARQLLPNLFRLCGESHPGRQSEAGPSPPQSSSRIAVKPKSSPPWPGFRLSDPDRVITRLDAFIGAYGARATLYELWNSNPAIFDLLLCLFDRSEFLAELAIRTPDLVDELVISGRLRRRKLPGETLRDLEHGIDDQNQERWLRQYHHAELMRIGLRDILGLADEEQYLAELSALAEASLQYALQVVMRRRRLRSPPFLIVGLGKLGGAEIDYGSDLDILFIAGSRVKRPAALSPLAVEVLELLSTQTEHGMLFRTDARLRPDGEKGLLVNTMRAYEEYYRHRAQLWEIQALTRARPVAGPPRLGAEFETLADELTDFAHPSHPLAAFSGDWRQTIYRMRLRIQKERTPPGSDGYAIKTGSGGLMDAEFVAQTLCLDRGWREPNTLRALQHAQNQGALPDADKLIRNYRFLRRVEGVLRRWSCEGEAQLPADPAPLYRVAVRCGFASTETFQEAVAACRRAIREVYLRVFEAELDK